VIIGRNPALAVLTYLYGDLRHLLQPSRADGASQASRKEAAGIRPDTPALRRLHRTDSVT
jgi:hypothetical protein